MTQGAQIWGSVIMQRGGTGWEVGGRVKREGTYVYLWLIHVGVWQKSMQYCKAIILQLPSPGESSQPRDRTQVSHIAGGFFTS